jgi:hypothetical protein
MILEWVKTLGPILISWPLVILIAILLFRNPLLSFFKGFTWENVKRLNIGSRGLEFEKDIKQVKEDINAIEFALKAILTKHEKGKLEGLAGHDPVNLPYEPDLYGYLHRLDGLDFIQPNEGLKYGLYDIVVDHKHEEELHPKDRPLFDLKQYVYITEEGKNYLKTWNDLSKKKSQTLNRFCPFGLSQGHIEYPAGRLQ